VGRAASFLDALPGSAHLSLAARRGEPSKDHGGPLPERLESELGERVMAALELVEVRVRRLLELAPDLHAAIVHELERPEVEPPPAANDRPRPRFEWSRESLPPAPPRWTGFTPRAHWSITLDLAEPYAERDTPELGRALVLTFAEQMRTELARKNPARTDELDEALDDARAELRQVPAPMPALEEERDMPTIASKHLFRGREMTVAELLRHPDCGAGLTAAAITMRLGRGGWPVELAVTSAKGVKLATAIGGAAKTTRLVVPAVTGRARAELGRALNKAAEENRSPVRIEKPIATQVTDMRAVDPLELLTRLGYRVEALGAFPRGRGFLLIEETAAT
jgi:hypothetical protein